MVNPTIDAASTFTDKRRHPRIPYMGSIEVLSENLDMYGLVKNISIGGLGVELHEQLEEGHAYTFVFSLPRNIKIKTKGQIRWGIHKGDAFVYGVRFLDLGFFARFKLKRFIDEQLKPGAIFNTRNM